MPAPLPIPSRPLALGCALALLIAPAGAQTILAPAGAPSPAAPLGAQNIVAPVGVLRAAVTGARTPIAPAGDPGAPATAQSLGSTLSATLSQRFEADTNFSLDDPSPGTSYFTDSRLSLGLLRETPIQALSLGFDTGLRAFWPADESFELAVASPSTASANYLRDWPGASLETGFRYRQARVDFDRPLSAILGIDPITGAPLPVGEGGVPVDAEGEPLTGSDLGELPDDLDDLTGETIERRYDADVTLTLAPEAPSSYEFSLDATRFDYSDTSTERIPRTSLRGSAGWTLRLTPVLSGALVARYYRYDAENDRETSIRESEIDAGVIYAASQTLRLSGGIGYVDRTQEETLGGETVTIDDGTGPALRAGVRYDRPRFRLDGDTRLSTADPDTRLSGDLRVSYPLLRSRINARVFRRYIGDSSGDEVRLTGGSIGIERELNQISRLGFDLSAANQVNEDVDEPDVRRFDASAVYSRDITEVVSADVGYSFRTRDEDPESATSHAVFFQIGRSFETRF